MTERIDTKLVASDAFYLDGIQFSLEKGQRILYPLMQRC